MEDYPQPVTGLIKDKSTEKKRHRDTETRYIMMTNQGVNWGIFPKHSSSKKRAKSKLDYGMDIRFQNRDTNLTQLGKNKRLRPKSA